MATVAQPSGQQGLHPLLRHPRPITRDSAKAQRMLGLIANSEEELTGLHREKSKTTKWLERPLYAHLDVSDVESENGEDHEQKITDKAFELNDDKRSALLLEQWTKPDQPTSFNSEDAVETLAEPKTKLDTSFVKRRPEPLKSLRPVSYNSQHLLSPEWTTSPATMSPNTQRRRPISLQPHSPNVRGGNFSSTTSSEPVSQFVHQQTWPVLHPQYRANGRAERPMSYQPPSSTYEQDSFSSLGNPQLNERRPRPTSSATYQHRDRRNSKIASSRGLRNNSYPNFSRPISDIAPKTIPGENIERFADDEVGPPTLKSPIRAALDGFKISIDKSRDEKKLKNRWSTIPQTLKKLANRRSSNAAQEPPSNINIDDLHRMNLTAESLHQVSLSLTTPSNSAPGVKLLPTPTYSPLDFKHPLFQAPLPPPFAPWAADVPPSPAASQEKSRDSDISLSSPRKRMQSRLSVESIVQSRPDSMHSRHSSFEIPSSTRHLPSLQSQPISEPLTSPRTGSRRGTPSLERICIFCKTTKQPSAFVNRRISANCWHEPATCFQCLQSHIESCVTTQGWEYCTCPECGEHMTYEDMGSFADDDTFIRWEE